MTAPSPQIDARGPQYSQAGLSALTAGADMYARRPSLASAGNHTAEPSVGGAGELAQLIQDHSGCLPDIEPYDDITDDTEWTCTGCGHHIGTGQDQLDYVAAHQADVLGRAGYLVRGEARGVRDTPEFADVVAEGVRQKKRAIAAESEHNSLREKLESMLPEDRFSHVCGFDDSGWDGHSPRRVPDEPDPDCGGCWDATIREALDGAQ